MSNWKTWPYDDCLHCGDAAEVLTSAESGFAYEDDKARCVACGCPGVVRVDTWGDMARAWIDWHDEPDCDCDWCKANPAEQHGEGGDE